jgi:DNA primase
VNFKELRAQLKFEDVLRHYGVEIQRKGEQRKGEQHQGPCPLPQHGKERRGPAFSANLERGIFNCFGCGAKGNVLEFAALMSGVDAADGQALRKVAVELQAKFCPGGASTRTKAKAADAPVASAIANAPLDFALKDLEADHPWLMEAELDRSTIAHFGLGHCSRGMLKGQIAIPLHNRAGQLVGYAGHTAAVPLSSGRNSEYIFPTDRERKGSSIEFRKSLLLYNSHRIKGTCDDLIVVEWFPSVWWLYQHDYANVVALMGPECSDEQANQIVALVKPSGRVWLVPSVTSDSRKLTEMVFALIACRRFVRWVTIGNGRQPSDLLAGEINSFFAL